ncbi:MAG TPA: caspase family protein [Pseudonocardiaceae bacterium]|nr:caspase family protein [Pseudonocardiaceae bacterium]
MALLIATYDYQDTGLRRLTAPAHDAEALAAVLQDPDIAGFEVTTLVNQPHHRIGEAIGDFYCDRRGDDLTLLYFTGHGLKDDNGRLYLAMSNTRRDSLLFTALSAEQIDQAMEGCVSRQKVLILDCCYSGAFPAGRIAKADTAVHALERFQGRGRTVLTASDATQYSFEGNQPHGQAAQSVFTRYLVAGLRDGSADLDGDGDITLDELYSYVHDRVVEEMPQQRPKKQDNVAGRIIIARNTNWTLPTHLRNALSSPIADDRLGALDGLAHLQQIGNGFVRRLVVDEIQRLADDDSRIVSAAAAARLHAILPQAPASPSEAVPQPTSAPAFAPATTPPVDGYAAPPSSAPGMASSRAQGHRTRPREDVTALPAEAGGHEPGNLAEATASLSQPGDTPVDPVADDIGQALTQAAVLNDEDDQILQGSTQELDEHEEGVTAAVLPDNHPDISLASPGGVDNLTTVPDNRRTDDNADDPETAAPSTATGFGVDREASASAQNAPAAGSGFQPFLGAALSNLLQGPAPAASRKPFPRGKKRLWTVLANAVGYAVGWAAIGLVLAIFIGWIFIDHRHNLSSNPTTGTKPTIYDNKCIWCSDPNTTRQIRYTLTSNKPIATTFATTEHDTRYLHAVPTLLNPSPGCRHHMSVSWSISTGTGNRAAMSERAAGELTDKDPSQIVEYLHIGKPSAIVFKASLQAPADCTVTLSVKDPLLHSLPPAMHWLAINSSEWN